MKTAILAIMIIMSSPSLASQSDAYVATAKGRVTDILLRTADKALLWW